MSISYHKKGIGVEQLFDPKEHVLTESDFDQLKEDVQKLFSCPWEFYRDTPESQPGQDSVPSTIGFSKLDESKEPTCTESSGTRTETSSSTPTNDAPLLAAMQKLTDELELLKTGRSETSVTKFLLMVSDILKPLVEKATTSPVRAERKEESMEDPHKIEFSTVYSEKLWGELDSSPTTSENVSQQKCTDEEWTK